MTYPCCPNARGPLGESRAYGVLLWEIFSYARTPYPGMSALKAAQAVAKGYRMDPPGGMAGHVGLVRIMTDCWETDRYRRPDASAIVQMVLYSNNINQTRSMLITKAYMCSW